MKLCNNCIYWQLGTAGLDDNYCSLTGEWADWEGTCEQWRSYMTKKRFTSKVVDWWHNADKVRVVFDNGEWIDADGCAKLLNILYEENEQLKKGMIRVVDKYIKNVECNPPSSARTYMKIKGALVNIREDLRSLIGDFE